MHGNDEKKLPDLAIVSRPIDCRNASLSKRKCSLVRYHVSYVIKYPLYNRLHQLLVYNNSCVLLECNVKLH